MRNLLNCVRTGEGRETHFRILDLNYDTLQRLSGKVILPRYSPFFPWNHSIDKRKEKREKSELECEERRERRELHEHFS